LLFYRNDHPYSKWQFEQNGQIITFNVTGDMSANDGDLVRRWPIAGKGIAYKSQLDVKNELAEGVWLHFWQVLILANLHPCIYFLKSEGIRYID